MKIEKNILAKELGLVARAQDFRRSGEPCLGIGSIVRLNSGGPRMMLVDLDGKGQITAAWGNAEASFPLAAVHRI